jgi:hypothetical protein
MTLGGVLQDKGLLVDLHVPAQKLVAFNALLFMLGRVWPFERADGVIAEGLVFSGADRQGGVGDDATVAEDVDFRGHIRSGGVIVDGTGRRGLLGVLDGRCRSRGQAKNQE